MTRQVTQQYPESTTTASTALAAVRGGRPVAMLSRSAPCQAQRGGTIPLGTVAKPDGQPLDVNFAASDKHQLAAAFEYFSQISQQLSDSYQALQQQVADLNAELSRAEARHEHEVAAKERVAGRLEGLLNTLPVGVVLLDVRGRVQDCNPAAIEFLGEPLLNERWLDIIARAFAPRMDDGHEVSLRDGRRVSISTRSLEVEPGQLIVLTDMTETRALQERLSHHQRLSALGKMVASLAHQIRTPLSAAMLYGEHLLQPDLAPPQQQRFAGKLMSRLNHLEQQVRDMLIFARTELPLADRTTASELLSAVAFAMEAPLESSGSTVEIINRAPDSRLQCNQDALVGAILNLVNNAIQAVAEGAILALELVCENDDYLAIRLRDHGPGFDAAIGAKVMEPFFTTKSHGTGLGLAVVQAVIRAHQGEMKIQSWPGEGTQVTLLLPLVKSGSGGALKNGNVSEENS